MPFSIAEICNDPDLAQPVTITRTKGQFVYGEWQAVNPPQQIPAYGVITIAGPKALEQVPEGDRVLGSLEFCTVTPIYVTSEDLSIISDEITWRGQLYRVQSVAKWADFGFWSAVLVRMQGS